MSDAQKNDAKAPSLTTKLGPLTLKNPVLTSSGTFGYGVEFSDFYDVGRLGALTTKAISVKPRPGNPPPRLKETPSGLINFIGLQNVGLEGFIKEKLPYLKQLKTKVIVNVVGDCVEDYVRVVSELSGRRGVHAFELNISCPNVKKGTFFGTSAKETAGLLKAVRKSTNLPVITKLTPNVTDITEVAKAAVDGGSDILSLVNTYRGMSFDVNAREPKRTIVAGGLSGPAIRPLAVHQTRQVAQALQVPIIGMGGIETAEDALQFMMAGASAVSVGTANFTNPMAAIDVLEGLARWMADRRIPSARKIVGAILERN